METLSKILAFITVDGQGSGDSWGMYIAKIVASFPINTRVQLQEYFAAAVFRNL